jgi:hypothetical protein
MTSENSSLNDYYFQDQIRKYLVQFMAIFSGLQVRVGENDNNSESELMKVPVVHGSKDRVVAHILAGNTPNMPVKLPMLSANIVGVEMAMDRMKGQGTTHTHTTLQRGDVFPDDIKTVKKLMPIPYRFMIELTVLTSSVEQKYEILEQIFLLFRPELEINTSDDADDWTALTYVRLNDIMMEENYPAGTEKRILATTMNFQVHAWMSAPYNVREDIIQKVKVRIQNIEQSKSFKEIAENAASRSVDGTDEYENIFDVSDLNPPSE